MAYQGLSVPAAWVVRAIFGADKADRGAVILRGNAGLMPSPVKAIQANMAMVKIRKLHGLLVNLSIYQNMLLAYYALKKGIWLHQKDEQQLTLAQVENLQIKTDQLQNPGQFVKRRQSTKNWFWPNGC